MTIYCPGCGRTRQYNPDQVGLTPKLCPCCIFTLETSSRRRGLLPRRRLSPDRLRPYGLTFVSN